MTCFPLSPSFNAAGETWDAVVPVTYLNPNTGQHVTVTVEIDTGASYSLAPASLASILGISLASGTLITLEGVNGQAFAAYLHSVTLQMDGLAFEGFLVAISSNENVPFLIGRTNFWNLASIRIDDLNRQVCIDPLPGSSTVVSTPTLSLVPLGIATLGIAAAAFTVYFLVKS